MSSLVLYLVIYRTPHFLRPINYSFFETFGKNFSNLSADIFGLKNTEVPNFIKGIDWGFLNNGNLLQHIYMQGFRENSKDLIRMIRARLESEMDELCRLVVHHLHTAKNGLRPDD